MIEEALLDAIRKRAGGLSTGHLSGTVPHNKVVLMRILLELQARGAVVRTPSYRWRLANNPRDAPTALLQGRAAIRRMMESKRIDRERGREMWDELTELCTSWPY